MRRQKQHCVAILLLGFACTSALADVAAFDTAFGTGGSTIIPQPRSTDWGMLLLGLPDGRFVIGGATAPEGAEVGALVAVLTPQGILDSTFGGGGFIRTTQISSAFSLSRDGSGKLLVGGDGSTSSNHGMTVLRLGLDGNLDPTWGSGGVAAVQVSGYRDYAHALLVQPDGKVVAVGEASYPNPASSYNDRSDFLTARFTSLGQLDSFFSGGVRQENFGEFDATTNIDAATAALLQPDGKILVAGYGGNIRPSDSGGTFSGGFHIVRYNTNGTRDGTFGSGGVAVTSFPQSDGWDAAFLEDLKLLPDGRILAVGYSSHSSLLIAAYHSDGSLDRDFAQGGKIEIPNCNSAFPQLVVQDDGSIRIVAMGDVIYDGLLDAQGHLIRWDVLDLPQLSLPGLNYAEYGRVLVLDDGDILALGRAAPGPFQVDTDWPNSTEILVSRFKVPEPAGMLSILMFALTRLSVRRRRHT